MGHVKFDLPQKSRGDDLSWDADQTGLEATRAEGKGAQETSIGRPLSTSNLPEKSSDGKLCGDILQIGGFGPTPPFFVFASVHKLGLFIRLGMLNSS